MALLTLLENLVGNRVDPQKQRTRIYTDSQLVVGQLTQGSKVNAENLVTLHKKAALLLSRTGAVLTWIPRTEIVRRARRRMPSVCPSLGTRVEAKLAAFEQPFLLPRDTDGKPRIHLQNFAALSLVRVLLLLHG